MYQNVVLSIGYAWYSTYVYYCYLISISSGEFGIKFTELINRFLAFGHQQQAFQ